jgi:hypothetical protein
MWRGLLTMQALFILMLEIMSKLQVDDMLDLKELLNASLLSSSNSKKKVVED